MIACASWTAPSASQTTQRRSSARVQRTALGLGSGNLGRLPVRSARSALGGSFRARPLKISNAASDSSASGVPQTEKGARKLPPHILARNKSFKEQVEIQPYAGPSVFEQMKMWVEGLSKLSWTDAARSIASSGAKVLGAVALVAAVFCLPSPAEAANSSGRMGGRSFASRSTGGGSYGGTTAATSVGAGTSSFGSSVGPSRLGGTTHVHTTHVVHTHSHVGGGFGFGFMPVYSPFGYSMGMGGGGSMLLVLVAMAVLAGVLMNMGSSDSGDEGYVPDDRISVMRLQVGLLGVARSLQDDLERIADSADTSTPQGLHYILSETCVSLLRHPQYWMYGSAAAANERSLEGAEARFGQLSLEERSKYENETLTNVGGTRTSKKAAGARDGMTNEFIVVTIIAAVDGDERLPKIENSDDLRSALSQIGGFGSNSVQAVEVMWTPQEVDDTLTSEEVITNYPTMAVL